MKGKRASEREQAGRSASWVGPAALGAALVLAAVMVYLPAMKAGFIWDDDLYLTNNPLIKASDGLYKFWFTTQPVDYYPLLYSVLWVEWRLFGMNAAGYHVVNVLLHAAVVVLIWRVLVGLKVPGAFWAALIFAVHPVNVATVAWVTELKNTLSMVFYVSAVLLFLRYDQRRGVCWYAGSLGCFVLALLSKTAVAMLPFVLLGCVWWRRGRLSGRDVLRVVPFMAWAAVLGAVTVWFQYVRAIGQVVVHPEGFASRLAASGWAVWFYAYKVLLPVNVMMVYPRWEVNGSSVISYVPLAVFIACLAVCWRCRRDWARPLLFGVGYFVVTLFPVLGFVDQGFYQYSLVADHWQYSSMIGIIALVIGGGRWLVESHRAARAIGWAATVALVGVLSVLTWRRAGVFQTAERLWRDNLKKNDRCWACCYNLGTILLDQNRPDEAGRQFRRTLEIKPDYASAHLNLGALLVSQGLAQEGAYHLETALKEEGNSADGQFNLGAAYDQLGKVDLAIQHYRQALEITPNLFVANYSLGMALLRVANLGEGIMHLRKAMAVRGEFVEGHYQLGLALAKAGREDEAISEYHRALALQPDSLPALNNLAWLLATNPDPKFRSGEEAVRLARRACELTTYKVPAFMDTLAAALAETGRFEEAASTLEKAVALALEAKQEEQAGQMLDRLARYKAKRPYRESGP